MATTLEGNLPSSLSSASLSGVAQGSNGTNGGSSGADYPVMLIRGYLDQLLPVIMSASPSALDDTMFDETRRGDAAWAQVAQAFATDAGTMTVYVDKVRRDDAVEGDEDSLFEYQLVTQPSYTPRHVSSIALIKRVPVLDPDIPIPQQVHILSLFGPASAALSGAASRGTPADEADAEEAQAAVTVRESPYEALHSVVHNVMAPWFDAYVSSKEGKAKPAIGAVVKSKDADTKMGIPMAKRKFAELELSLLHLQQNVEIPEIHLVVHPVVRSTVERCRAAGDRVKPDDVQPQAMLQDSSFLNKLQADVNAWVKEVQTVTKLDRDVASGTASQEINFWLSMEKAHENIEEQLRSEPIVLTLDILKHAKRFHATVSFYADTGLKECTEKVHNYNLLMKDFPLNELLSATDLEKCGDALGAVFSHLNKKLRISPYPVKRALPLVEAISRDLNETLLKVLASQRLMYLDFPRFCDTVAAAMDVFGIWDELTKDFVNIAREVTRKRSERFIPIKISPAHAKLRERLTYISGFRKTHEQLRVMVSSGKGMALASTKLSSEQPQIAAAQNLAGIEMADEIREAYESVKVVDVLDVTPEGTEVWSAAESAYNERVARVENSLIARLRDLLGQAKSAREMLRVLSQFNSLFVRPKVRGAVQEYQQQLLHSVKGDISGLHDKFKAQYRPSEANHMSQLRDLPEIAGAIVWARQIERQLNVYMKRVEDVLGKGWELYAEGQKLQNESETFRRKLDTTPLFEGWLFEIHRRDMSISGRLFEVSRSRATDTYQLNVNFDAQVIALFKEVRNLIWLHFQIPHSILNLAKDAKRVYPHAVSLMETVRTYTQTCAQVRANPGIACLIAQSQSDVHALITQGMSLRWEHFANSYESHRAIAYLPGTSGVGAPEARENKQVAFVRQFASVVSLFQDKTNDLIEMQREIAVLVDELSNCPYTHEAFAERLAKIQKTIDRLNLEGYPNLDDWVAQLDGTIEATLTERIRLISLVWCEEFAREDRAGGAGASVLRDVSNTVSSKRKAAQDKRLGAAAKAAQERDHIELAPVTHEIRIQNQVIYLDPPMEHARATWFRQLHEVLAVVCGLKRVQSSRYEIGLQMRNDQQAVEQSYASLLTHFADDTLRRPFALIEGKIAELTMYVAKWLQFQSLWDLESEHVYARLGDSLANWQQLLSEIRKTRSTFDNSDTQRSFGIAVIDYEQVQSKVNAKYDTWQRDILNRFGVKLGTEMRETHAAIRHARTELEQHSIEASSTAQTVTFITSVQELKRKTKKWAPQIEIFGTGQKTLERQRYMFPQDWLYVDQVEGEWSAFNEILGRKNASIQDQLAGLQMKIIAEDRIVSDKIAVIVGEWEQQKPIAGTLKADAAMNTINVFEARVSKLAEDRDLVVRAKESLDLEHTTDDRLEPIMEELRDLKAVWTALSGTWSQLAELRETNWSNVQPRKLRQQIDALLTQTKDMPSRMRQYAAFEHVQDHLRSLLKSNVLLADLRSEAMRERHWRSLFKQLKIQSHYTPSSMTLGTVWDLDLKRHEATIKAVIATAQGELALEEYLKQVRETWTSYDLELVNYQNKCRLIRGWDQLFTTAGDHLSALRSMTMSPHYKVFEEEASLWLDRITKIQLLFDVWIDVQRQWVYLEGIFSGSAEIRHVLPVESSRFSHVNTELLTVYKKVYAAPFVLQVIAIPGVQKSLERLADLLAKLQKALGDYLERERAQCPRFYFVSDSDLLEILGNSSDILRVCECLQKMFPGIRSVQLDEEKASILALVSPQDEVVPLRKPVLCKGVRVNDWIANLEREMNTSMAHLLSAAVADLQKFYSQPDALPELLPWIGRYPAQVLILGLKIMWTQRVDDASPTQDLASSLAIVTAALDLLANHVLTDLNVLERRKVESLMTEIIFQRDVIRQLIDDRVSSQDFAWQSQMRFYIEAAAEQREDGPPPRLTVLMADASFEYGWEYLGLPESMVITPLTVRCFMTLTQALKYKLGGAPFGPAGTGKTESVKLTASALGLPSVVFCCDENFSSASLERILVGVCRVGAFACFDEFNRLDEKTLSAVGQQIAAIQQGLAASQSTGKPPNIEMGGKSVEIHPRTGIFITTNPTYAGRTQLPASLKRLFRSIAMAAPDRTLIAQVLLFSQGFRTAEALASKVVPLFMLCAEQLSEQPHYDFGLRALKSVLTSAGQLKRERLDTDREAEHIETAASLEVSEQEILIQSISETVVPKLVAEDVPLLSSLLQDVFPGVEYKPVDLAKLKDHVAAVCAERHLVCEGLWFDKVVQLCQIQKISHGVMLVGPSSTGKTQAWQVLLAALERFEGIEGVSYVIDPKAISKDALYGTLDPTTREWTDGLFTHILRKIVDNVRGESSKRHWIIFDGDVDPEWVENLNSVLDDNKMLTLPNGERINLPPNVRVMFEVEHLRYATLATVSRCGMIWFSDDNVKPDMLYTNYLGTLRNVVVGSEDGDLAIAAAARRQAAAVGGAPGAATEEISPDLQTQRVVAEAVAPFFEQGALVDLALEHAMTVFHIMDFTVARALTTLFSLINKTARNACEYNTQHADFPLTVQQIEAYATKRLVVALVWSFTGDSKLDVRAEMGEFLKANTGVDLPQLGGSVSLIDFDVQVGTGEWFNWTSRVPTIEIETHAVASADVVIPTMDTVRHEEVLYSWLSEHKPLMLCGPPGSGKTMTLFSALRKLPDQEVVGLNFSSATTPELILTTFEQYCEYRKTPEGVVLAPSQIGRWLVVFCDEINLPALDKYGTQRVISFLRQLVEVGGFWRTSDKSWVRLERIQFVGACNPPTDPGRVPLSHRFLRHAPLVMVDYPGEVSLNQIYATFNRALLKLTPNLRGYAEALTAGMVDFFLASQKRFTPDIQAHYIYSPRELSRWVRGLYEHLKPMDDTVTLEGLVRIWAHEGLRLFRDRLVNEDEKEWTDSQLDATALQHFPTVERSALERPIIFSNWLTRHTSSVALPELRSHTVARLAQYSEEELDTKLVLHDSVLGLATSVDRVLRQRQGHLLLIGASGSGRTTVTRFVAWLVGLSVFTIAPSRKYGMPEFDDDLRTVLRRAGCQGEKICFVIDESQIKSPAFLERMNTLLANSEVPGLFVQAELVAECKEGVQGAGLMLDSDEELLAWFREQVSKNLHVVFTMNVPEHGVGAQAAASPALFNRCTLLMLW